MLHFGEGVKASICDECIKLTHPGSDYQFLIRGSKLKPRVFEGWHEGEEVHGISGLGFMHKENRVSIALAMPLNDSYKWNFSAVPSNSLSPSMGIRPE
jgi:hypothetical protein